MGLRAHSGRCDPPPDSHDDCVDWVAVKELKLSYHNPDTILFVIYPYHGHFN